jgi:hypothetical protein
MANELFMKGQEKSHDSYVCKPKYVEKAGNCYLVDAAQKTFFEASEWCKLNQANLVSIHNAAEDDLAKVVCGHRMCWIGLSEKGGTATTHKDEQIWQWEDGSSLTYSNWQPGEPNNYGGNDERYAFMNLDITDIPGLPRLFSGKWFDGPKQLRAHALCRASAEEHGVDGGIVPAVIKLIGMALILACISGVCLCYCLRKELAIQLPPVFGYAKIQAGVEPTATEMGKTQYTPPTAM